MNCDVKIKVWATWGNIVRRRFTLAVGHEGGDCFELLCQIKISSWPLGEIFTLVVGHEGGDRVAHWGKDGEAGWRLALR